MAVDFKLTSDFRVEWDDSGDVASLSGVEQIEQAIIIQLVETLPLRAPPPDAGEIERQRADIEEAVSDADVTEPPVSVSVVSSPLTADQIDGTLSATYRVETGRVAIDVTTD